MVLLSHIVDRYRARLVLAKYKAKKVLDSGTTVYTYSERQIANRNKKKEEKLAKLGKNIEKLRSKVTKDLKSKDPETMLTALVISLLDHTAERIGNPESAKGNRNEDGEPHFGVTGWQKQHVSFSGKGATIKYVGKSGVKHEKIVTDPAIKKALKDAYEAADGDESDLFSWDGGKVTAAKVNAYLKDFDITAKTLRGHHANSYMREALKKFRSSGKKLPEDKKAREKILKAEWKRALDEAAEKVGHEPNTLSGDYLVPGLEEAYLKDGSIPEPGDK